MNYMNRFINLAPENVKAEKLQLCEPTFF